MSVVHVGTRPQTSGSAHSVRNNLLFETLGRRYLKHFIAVTDNARDRAETILSSILVPQVGDSYVDENSSDSVATCVDVNVESTNSPYIWYGTAEYDTDRIVSTVIDNPLNQPYQLTWSSVKIERPMLRDFRNIPVMNSANEAFLPPFTFEETRPILTLVRNEATFSPAVALAFQDALNLNTFAGAAPYCCKLNSIMGSNAIQNGINFWSVTYEFEFRREGFWVYALDHGFRDINGQLFRDPIEFTPLQNPTPLNGRGLEMRGKTTILQNLTFNTTDTTVIVLGPDVTKFPPAPIAGKPWGDFQIQIDNEILNVTAGQGTVNWTVTRGYAGTTAASHSTGATITLLPYYLKYLPAKALDYSSLSLPSI